MSPAGEVKPLPNAVVRAQPRVSIRLTVSSITDICIPLSHSYLI